MSRISLRLLRALVSTRAYRDAAVVSSISGGWLLARPKHLQRAA